MAVVRFCRVEIFEGEESRLRDYYAQRITTSGAVRYADGVKHGMMPMDYVDLACIHPKGLGNLMGIMKNLPEVKFSPIEEAQA